MARTMTETSTGVYRTVVRTEFLDDGPVDNYWNYETHDYEKRPRWVAGHVRTEVFGPYSEKSVNRNYSYENGWRYKYNEETKKRDYVKYANITVEKQTLAPVFALQSNGSLTMELDWVKYGN